MFSTTTELMPHQQSAVAKLLPSRVGALFMDMGTGKSRTLLELAKLRQNKWDRLFWFTPCALRENVREQILTHTDAAPEDIEVWDGSTLDRGIREVRFHVVGIETMGQSDRAVLAYSRLVTEESYVAVDESTYIKGHDAKRTVRLTALSACSKYRTVMTGTPITQGVVDLYAQMKFLSPKILGYRSFWSFAANHLEYEERKGADGHRRATKRIVGSHNKEFLAAKISPYTYQVKKEECLALPDKIHLTRYTSMTPEQEELYYQVKEDILAQAANEEEFNPIWIFQLFTALQSVVCGFLGSSSGNPIEVRHNRIELLLSTVAEIGVGEQVIVWAKYLYSAAQISATLAEVYGPENVCEFHGDLSDTKRQENLARWRSGARFLVATQSSGGHGLTLTEAAYSIFYADGFKYSERAQAEDRTHRIGQTRKSVYISLHCRGSIDDRIAAALSTKGGALASFTRQVEEHRSDRLKQRVFDLVRSL